MIKILDKQFVHGAWSVLVYIESDTGTFTGCFVIQGDESMTDNEIADKIKEGL